MKQHIDNTGIHNKGMEFCFYFILIGIRRILLYLYSSQNNHTHIHTKKGKASMFCSIIII